MLLGLGTRCLGVHKDSNTFCAGSSYMWAKQLLFDRRSQVKMYAIGQT